MHYKNGREAKAGDKVIELETGQSGIVHSLQAEATCCNARLAVPNPNDQYVSLNNCLHVDDVKAANVPDATKVAQ